MAANAKAGRAGAVMIAGSGLWADALARVVTRGGGTLLYGRSPEESLAVISAYRPSAVAAGPPFTETSLIDFCTQARKASPGSTILAAVNRADAVLRAALEQAGVSRVCIVPSAAGDLAVGVVNVAGLTTRVHRRVPFTAIATVVTRDGRLRGRIRDLSEGGLCLERVAERVMRGPARIEFELPNQTRPVATESEVVWSGRDETGHRAGIRFAGLSDADRDRIRGFVRNQPSAA